MVIGPLPWRQSLFSVVGCMCDLSVYWMYISSCVVLFMAESEMLIKMIKHQPYIERHRTMLKIIHTEPYVTRIMGAASVLLCLVVLASLDLFHILRGWGWGVTFAVIYSYHCSNPYGHEVRILPIENGGCDFSLLCTNHTLHCDSHISRTISSLSDRYHPMCWSSVFNIVV